MNKTKFEEIIARRAESIYQDKKMSLLRQIANYFKSNTEINVHELGNSLEYEIDQLVNGKIEKRKSEIINKIISSEMNKIFSNLESVKFLFEEESK